MKYNTLQFKKARSKIEAFRIMNEREMEDDKYLLQIKFKKNDVFGLAIWDNMNNKFESVPMPYENYNITQYEVEEKFGFIHIGQPILKDNLKYSLTHNSIIFEKGCIIDYEILVHELLFNLLLSNNSVSIDNNKSIHRQKREVLKIEKPITIKIF